MSSLSSPRFLASVAVSPVREHQSGGGDDEAVAGTGAESDEVQSVYILGGIGRGGLLSSMEVREGG